jgi:hypothetical protein
MALIEGDTGLTGVSATKAVSVDASTGAMLVEIATGAPTPGTSNTTEETQLKVETNTSRLLTSAGRKTAGSALATTAMQVGAAHLTVLPTLTDTQECGLQLDASGKLLVSGAFYQTTQPVSLAAAVTIAGFTAQVITTATTTLVRSGAGLLHGITVNSLGTVASTIEVYDALTATGTPIAIIDSLNLSGQFLYDINFATGLTLVTTGTVAPNLTVSYR